MKKRVVRRTGLRADWPWLIFLALITTGNTAFAAQLSEAKITRIVKDVQELPEQTSARPAALNDVVGDKTAVRTGAASRSELTFTDQTLTRLGANTIFSFTGGTRNVALSEGVILVQVPKGAGGAKIVTAAVTAGVTGTTVMEEFHPHSYLKFIVLEGTARLYLQKKIGESVLVRAGQMLIVNPDARSLPDPVDVDLRPLIETSTLITDFPPLSSWDLITREVNNQKSKKARGELIATNMAIYGRGTLVTLNNPPPVTTIDQKIAAVGSLGPIAHIGPLKTILAPSPFFIGSGTKITTAPVITNNGVTAGGKLYRGPGLDGQPSKYFFGSTSPFDVSSGFDTTFPKLGLPVATFRFGELLLTGSPKINRPAGGPRSLALISESFISPEAPGGPVTFAGMKSVLLATVSGGIFFDPVISFSNIDTLTLYARGVGAGIVLDAPVQNVGSLNLFAEGPATIDADETLTKPNSKTGPGDGGTLAVTAGSDVLISGANINASSGIIASTTVQSAGAGGNVSLVSQDGSVTVDNSTIKVSSADPAGAVNRQTSNSGGNINIQSGTPTNVAINITNTSQLLSLLNSAAPGPGGTITFKATGTMSSIMVGGKIEADAGTIDVRQMGTLGTITLNSMDMRGDIIKIAAFGDNGMLTIGSGTLSADTMLKLYAPGSNGMINFVANCTIGGNTATIIAANTVTVAGGVTVMITGPSADIFTKTANYSMTNGGNGSSSGRFVGSSIVTHLNQPPPPFD